MNPLIVNSTKANPSVCLDPANRKYLISGKSCPEDPHEIFDPIMDWLNENLPKIDHEIEFTIQSDFFNSVSNRFLHRIFKLLETYYQSGKDIVIIWYYDDDETKHNGLIFSELIELPFRFVNNPIAY
jgi:hypothetical protein